MRRARAPRRCGAKLRGRPAGSAERANVKNVLPGSPADKAGLTYGDELVALDGDRVNATTFAKRLADHPAGRAVTVSYFRRDRLQEARLVVGTSPERKLLLEPSAQAPAEAVAIRRGWLGLGGR